MNYSNNNLNFNCIQQNPAIENEKKQSFIQPQNTFPFPNLINKNEYDEKIKELNNKIIYLEQQLEISQNNAKRYEEFYNKFAQNHKKGRRPSKKLKGKLNEIKNLKEAGHSNREIANLYGVTETTIRRYLKKINNEQNFL